MTGTYLIAAAMVAIVVLPAILFTASAKRHIARRRAEMKQVFEKLVANHQLTISQKDEHLNLIIAIDELKMMLLFIKHDNDRVHRQLIPLTQVTQCTIQHIGNKIVQLKKNGTSTSQELIDEVRLGITLMSNATLELTFYKEAQDGVYERMKLTEAAEKWQSHIKKALITAIRA